MYKIIKLLTLSSALSTSIINTRDYQEAELVDELENVKKIEKKIKMDLVLDEL